MRKHAKMLADARVTASERSIIISKATSSLKVLRDQTLRELTNIRQPKEIIRFLLVKEAVPRSITDYDEINNYERLLRFFGEGGAWRHIHTLAVRDPYHKVVQYFIDNYAVHGADVEASCAPLVKLVCCMH